MDDLINVINKEIETKSIEPKYLINILVSCLESICEKIVISDEELYELRRKCDDVTNLISNQIQKSEKNIKESKKYSEEIIKLIDDSQKFMELVESFLNDSDFSANFDKHVDKFKEFRQNFPQNELYEELSHGELQEKHEEIEKEIKENHELIEFFHNNPNISTDRLKEFVNSSPSTKLKEKLKKMLSESEVSESDKNIILIYKKKLYEIKLRNEILGDIIKTSKKMKRYHFYGESMIISLSFSLWFFIDSIVEPFPKTIIMRLIIGLIAVLFSYFILDNVVRKIRSFRDWKIVERLKDYFIKLNVLKHI